MRYIIILVSKQISVKLILLHAANVYDNCALFGQSNPDQADRDIDGVGNICDNCPANPNSDQTDTDGDGVGDVCDDDLSSDKKQLAAEVMEKLLELYYKN